MPSSLTHADRVEVDQQDGLHLYIYVYFKRTIAKWNADTIRMWEGCFTTQSTTQSDLTFADASPASLQVYLTQAGSKSSNWTSSVHASRLQAVNGKMERRHYQSVGRSLHFAINHSVLLVISQTRAWLAFQAYSRKPG